MDKLTIEQAMHVADGLHEIADAFAAYVISMQDSLAPQQKEQLISDQAKILETANNLLTYASDLVFNDIDVQMKQLDNINITISEKLEKLAEIQKVIEISASFLVLLQAIISARPLEVAKATHQLYKNLGIKRPSDEAS